MNKYILNFNWLFAEKVIQIFGGVFISVWVARYLGPEQFGLLSYSIAYAGLFLLFVNLGLDKILVRELVNFPNLKNDLLGTAFVIKFIGSLIAVAIISVSLFFLDIDNLTRFVILITSAGFIFSPVDVIDYFYQSEVLSKYVIIARNSSFCLTILLKIYLILSEFGVIYFAIANVLLTFLSSLFMLIIYKITGHFVSKWKFNKQLAFKLLKYSWPIAAAIFFTAIHMRIDQIMVGNMLNMNQLGIYSVAVRLSEFWIFIPGIIVSTLMPYFVNLRETNRNLYDYRLLQLYSFMFWLGAGFSLIIVLFGKDLLLIVFGNKYVDTYPALVLLMLGMILRGQSVARRIWVISENLQFYIIWGSIIAAASNILLNFYFIPKMGITGAAVATLITIIVNNWITPILIIRQYRKNTIDSIRAINPLFLLPANWIKPKLFLARFG